jgi:hypothetical protein
MDKAHIHVQHGTFFCNDIFMLQVEYFWRVFSNQQRELRPQLIALTAMFSSSYVQLLLELLTVNLTIGDCILRGSTVDFCQREISMKLKICSNKAQFVSKGLILFAEFLNNNHGSSVVIFCNS